MTRRSIWVFLPFLVLLLWQSAHASPAREGVVQAVTVTDHQALLTLQDATKVALTGLYVPGDATSLAAWRGKAVTLQQLFTDRYGQLGAVVKSKGEKQSLQETLLCAGEAVAYSPAAISAWKKWQGCEQQAEQQGLGWWRTHPVLTPQQAADHLQQFVLVEGRVTHTHQSRDHYYINFGEDWKTDFSLTIPRSAWRSFKDHLLVDEGAKIRARGVLISQNGPMLIITRPEQLEVEHADTH